MLALVSSNGGEGSYESHGNLVPNIFPGTCRPCETSCAVSMCTVLLTQNGVAMGTPPTHTHPWVKAQVFLSSVFSSTSVRSSLRLCF